MTRRGTRIEGRYLWVAKRRFRKGKSYSRIPKIIWFTWSNQGSSKRGKWELWSLIRPGGHVLTGRVRPGKDPGHRFRAVLAEPEDNEFHQAVREAIGILPSPPAMVKRWMDGHPSLRRYARGWE